MANLNCSNEQQWPLGDFPAAQEAIEREIQVLEYRRDNLVREALLLDASKTAEFFELLRIREKANKIGASIEAIRVAQCEAFDAATIVLQRALRCARA